MEGSIALLSTNCHRVTRAHENRAAAKLGAWTSALNREWLTAGEGEFWQCRSRPDPRFRYVMLSFLEIDQF
jgi:hypothetical protein